MQSQTYNFILNNLTESLHSIQATRIYMDHQMSLPDHLRVMHDDEDTVLEERKVLIKQQNLYEQAIAELRADKQNLVHD